MADGTGSSSFTYDEQGRIESVTSPGSNAVGYRWDLDGSGSADIYYQGQKYSAKWSSADRKSPLVFTNDAGQPIAMPPGPVWVEVVPS